MLQYLQNQKYILQQNNIIYLKLQVNMPSAKAVKMRPRLIRSPLVLAQIKQNKV